eukprot:3213319-Rhodomonas_salina.1
MEELEPEVAARFAPRTRLSELGRDEAHIASGGSNAEGQSRFGRASAPAPRSGGGGDDDGDDDGPSRGAGASGGGP